jgi:hypothetical protein
LPHQTLAPSGSEASSWRGECGVCKHQQPSSSICGQSTANNFLEFLGMAVKVWLMCLTFTDQLESLLAIGNHTFAIGWLFRSSRISPDSLCYYALQLGTPKLAMLVTNSKHCLASQHIKGETNSVADLLSWSGDVRGTPHPLAMDQLGRQATSEPRPRPVESFLDP